MRVHYFDLRQKSTGMTFRTYRTSLIELDREMKKVLVEATNPDNDIEQVYRPSHFDVEISKHGIMRMLNRQFEVIPS